MRVAAGAVGDGQLAETPLGWLLARGHVSRRQYDAGERLRIDWERSELAPQVTMAWDAAPIARGRGGAAPAHDLNGAPDRRPPPFPCGGGERRAGPVRHIVAGGLRRRRHARGRNGARLAGAGGQAGAGLALDRLAVYYRMG